MIKINNISKSWGSKKTLSSIDVSIDGGQIFGFIGHNGAGKTTLIKIMCGIWDSSDGDILIDGISIKNDPVSAKRKFYYNPDNPELFFMMEAFEYIKTIASLYNISKDNLIERVKKYSSLFEIENSLGTKLSELSHGMRQKIFLITALVVDPLIWILDEPMVGLDAKSRAVLKDIMKERAKEGKLVFLTSHDLLEVEQICKNISLIKDGNLIYTGSITELKKKYSKLGNNLESIYLELEKANV